MLKTIQCFMKAFILYWEKKYFGGDCVFFFFFEGIGGDYVVALFDWLLMIRMELSSSWYYYLSRNYVIGVSNCNYISRENITPKTNYTRIIATLSIHNKNTKKYSI